MNESDFEHAQRLSDTLVAQAVQEAQKSKMIPAKGVCYNCGEKLPPFSGQRWCDADCMTDWQKRGAR